MAVGIANGPLRDFREMTLDAAPDDGCNGCKKIKKQEELWHRGQHHGELSQLYLHGHFTSTLHLETDFRGKMSVSAPAF